MFDPEVHTKGRKKFFAIFLLIFGIIFWLISSQILLPKYKASRVRTELTEQGFSYGEISVDKSRFLIKGLHKPNIDGGNSWAQCELQGGLWGVQEMRSIELNGVRIHLSASELNLDTLLGLTGFKESIFKNSILELEHRFSFSLNGISMEQGSYSDSLFMLDSKAEKIELHHNRTSEKEELSLFAENICLADWEGLHFGPEYFKKIKIIYEADLQAELLITNSSDSEKEAWAFIASNQGEVEDTFLEGYKITAFSLGVYGDEEGLQKSSIIYSLQSIEFPLNPMTIVTLNQEGGIKKLRIEYLQIEEAQIIDLSSMKKEGMDASLQYEVSGDEVIDELKLRRITQNIFNSCLPIHF